METMNNNNSVVLTDARALLQSIADNPRTLNDVRVAINAVLSTPPASDSHKCN